MLLAGDAVITVEQESLADVVIQKQELHGPPAYFTADTQTAAASVQKLAELEPEALLTGHGIPMTGKTTVRICLHWLKNCIPFCKTPAKITGVFSSQFPV